MSLWLIKKKSLPIILPGDGFSTHWLYLEPTSWAPQLISGHRCSQTIHHNTKAFKPSSSSVWASLSMNAWEWNSSDVTTWSWEFCRTPHANHWAGNCSMSNFNYLLKLKFNLVFKGHNNVLIEFIKLLLGEIESCSLVTLAKPRHTRPYFSPFFPTVEEKCCKNPALSSC